MLVVTAPVDAWVDTARALTSPWLDVAEGVGSMPNAASARMSATRCHVWPCPKRSRGRAGEHRPRDGEGEQAAPRVVLRPARQAWGAHHPACCSATVESGTAGVFDRVLCIAVVCSRIGWCLALRGAAVGPSQRLPARVQGVCVVDPPCRVRLVVAVPALVSSTRVGCCKGRAPCVSDHQPPTPPRSGCRFRHGQR